MSTATLESDTATPIAARSEALNEHVLLIAPTLGWWKGQYQIGDAKVLLDGVETDDESTTKPQTKLMKCASWLKDWVTVFTALDAERKALVNKYSLPFPITGVRIIPKRVAAEFFRSLIGPVDDCGQPRYDYDSETQSIAYRLGEAADRFCSLYDRLIETLERELHPTIWKRVSKLIPDRVALRRTFYLDITPIELSGDRGRTVTRSDLDAFNDVIRESTMRRVDEAVEEMIRGPREELAKAITDLDTLIRRDGRVRADSFNPVRKAIEKIRLFDFIANDTLLEQINSLEGRLGITNAATLDSETANSNGFLTAIGTLREEILDAESQADDFARFGRRARGFTLD